jgi:hypothetical protein
MPLDNQLITNRPKQLLGIEYYTELPKLPIEFNYASLPELLNIDLTTLIGIMPQTTDLVRNTQFEFYTQPSQKEVEYYRKRNTKFQLINVVANIHTFKKINDDMVCAYPYSISLVVGQKRGIPDQCSIELLSKLNLEKISQRHQIYTDFSPFKPVEIGFYGNSAFSAKLVQRHYTDTIGFVLESYFLPTDIDLNDVTMLIPNDFDQSIIDKFNKYRIKRYYTPFTNLKPRKIWGCDSPIELFLIQALASKKLFPVIQTLVFKNGHIYDNFFEMIKNKIFIKGDELITEVDLYFPKNRLAIFCDSTQFHRGRKNENKDSSIDKALADIGIDTLRLTGKDIINNLDKCVEKIINKLLSFGLSNIT